MVVDGVCYGWGICVYFLSVYISGMQNKAVRLFLTMTHIEELKKKVTKSFNWAVIFIMYIGAMKAKDTIKMWEKRENTRLLITHSN